MTPSLDFVPASLPSVVVFVAIVVAVIAAVPVAGFRSAPPETRGRAAAKLAAGIVAWLALVSAVVASGVLEAEPFPRVAMFLGLCVLAGAALALSPVGGRIAAGVPLAYLVAFQGFRLPLELVLHSWAEQGTIPVTMTWTGSNVDVVSGVLALACAPFAPRMRSAAWIANVVGFGLLLNVGRVAVMSSPFPFAWGVEPPLQLAFHLPYAWIVPVCVAGAFAGHIVLTRALLRR